MWSVLISPASNAINRNAMYIARQGCINRKIGNNNRGLHALRHSAFNYQNYLMHEIEKWLPVTGSFDHGSYGQFERAEAVGGRDRIGPFVNGNFTPFTLFLITFIHN